MSFFSDNIPGVILTIIIILGIFVEITPVKLSPLSWIGKKINKQVFDEIQKTNTKITEIEGKLDEHIADDMRTYIMNFQWECLNGEKHTVEEWYRVHQMCGKYEQYVKDNHLSNNEADLAIQYIKETYAHCLHDESFIFTVPSFMTNQPKQEGESK